MTSNKVGATARISTMAGLGLVGLLALPAWSQKFPNLPITPEQSATAKQVAQAGVPLSELAPNAPDTYVIKRGDTLWDISRMYLKGPWRWPELWGMNLEEIRNPHLIYPGQALYLIKRDGRAQLSTRPPGTEPSLGGDAAPPNTTAAAGDTPPTTKQGSDEIETVRLSPRVRSSEPPSALPLVRLNLIEPFLDEPQIVEEKEFLDAPRIVAATENRVLIGQGDRVYARGPAHAPLMDDQQQLKRYRIYRNAKPLKDPDTGEVLAYEAEFLGKANLERSEGKTESTDNGWSTRSVPVPATIDVRLAKLEILVGDRLALEPEREFLNFVPHAPSAQVNGRILSLYGSSAFANAGQNQIVVVSLGQRNGLAAGHVLAILKDGQRLVDRTDSDRPLIKLPNERNGLLLVFRVYEKVSYGLILEVNDTVRVGDRLVNPQVQ